VSIRDRFERFGSGSSDDDDDEETTKQSQSSNTGGDDGMSLDPDRFGDNSDVPDDGPEDDGGTSGPQPTPPSDSDSGGDSGGDRMTDAPIADSPSGDTADFGDDPFTDESDTDFRESTPTRDPDDGGFGQSDPGGSVRESPEDDPGFGLSERERSVAIGSYIASNSDLVDTGAGDPDGGIYTRDDITIRRNDAGDLVVGPSEAAIERERSEARADRADDLELLGGAVADTRDRFETEQAIAADEELTDDSTDLASAIADTRNRFITEQTRRQDRINDATTSPLEGAADRFAGDSVDEQLLAAGGGGGGDLDDVRGPVDANALDTGQSPIVGQLRGEGGGVDDIVSFASDPAGESDVVAGLVEDARGLGDAAGEAADDAVTTATFVPRTAGSLLGVDTDSTDTLATAAGVGVVAPEPTSTVGGLGVLALLGGAAAVDSQLDRSELPLPEQPANEQQNELPVGDPNSQVSELDVSEGDVSELGVEESRTDVSELDIPDDAPNPDLSVLRTAQSLGRQRARQTQRETDESNPFRREQGANNEELNDILSGPDGEVTLGRETPSGTETGSEFLEPVEPVVTFGGETDTDAPTESATEPEVNTGVQDTVSALRDGAQTPFTADARGSGVGPDSGTPSATTPGVDVNLGAGAFTTPGAGTGIAAGLQPATGVASGFGASFAPAFGAATATGTSTGTETTPENLLRNRQRNRQSGGGGGGGGGRRSPRRRPDGDDFDVSLGTTADDADETDGDSLLGGAAVSGFFSETATAAAGIGVEGRAPATDTPDDVAAITGEVPTVAQASGDADAVTELLSPGGGGPIGGSLDFDFGVGGDDA